MKGEPFADISNFSKKFSDRFVSSGFVCYGEKRTNIWLRGPNETIWPLKICRTSGRTILVSSYGLKERVTYIVAFHFMKRRLKRGNFQEINQKCADENPNSLFFEFGTIVLLNQTMIMR